MAFEIRLPAMGEGITDATIMRWLVKEGDKVTKDTSVAEIATDKVDSEIMASVEGIIEKILKPENSSVKVGEVMAIINTGKNSVQPETMSYNKSEQLKFVTNSNKNPVLNVRISELKSVENSSDYKYISPFVRSLAMREGLAIDELNTINGSGENNRITKEDILRFLTIRKSNSSNYFPEIDIPIEINGQEIPKNTENETYVELNRVRKVIAENMVRSRQISPHVSSFVEANVTTIVNWRTGNKKKFQDKYGVNLTYMPIIAEAVVKALKDFPQINASVSNNYLVLKKNINIGIATALPDGNLVVPVIKNAENLNIAALANSIALISSKARSMTLMLNETQDGTFTITNAGTFGNLGGTPIIRQPELAILAVGAIVKKPVALKNDNYYGIAIQDILQLWLSYDHRVIDGFLGGSFLKKIADYLEQFDVNTPV